jgi:hypothetical protein
MLQAQIEIVDESGRTEESARILGSGRVSIGKRTTGGLLHVDEAESDYGSVVKDGAEVVVQLKSGSARYALDALHRAIDVFLDEAVRHLKVTQVVADGDLLAGNAIIRTLPSSAPLGSSLVRRAQASAARGAVAVSQQLQRLRDQGKLDESDRLLVPLPADMKPGSQTDL